MGGDIARIFLSHEEETQTMFKGENTKKKWKTLMGLLANIYESYLNMFEISSWVKQDFFFFFTISFKKGNKIKPQTKSENLG